MSPLRFATFNMLHGLSVSDGLISQTRLIEAVRVLGADVLGLQEVDRHQPRSGTVHQTEVVAVAMRAVSWRFVPALLGTPDPPRRWTAVDGTDGATAGPAYGIGLVSRLPVRAWYVRRFAAARVGAPLRVPGERLLVPTPDQPRVAVAAVVDGPQGPFTVANVHLSFVPGWNVMQLRALTHWLGTLPGPRVLLGDLNLPGRLPARLTGWTQLARALTYPAHRPRVQLDHVLTDRLGDVVVQHTGVLALGVSDHRALVVDVDANALVPTPSQPSTTLAWLPRQRVRVGARQASSRSSASRSGRSSGRSVRPSRT